MKSIHLTLILSLSLLILSCSKESTTQEVAEEQDVVKQSFIWRGLNAYYLWQEDVANLSDTRFSSEEQLNSFLAGYSDPENLFDNLLYQKGTIDKWSWIVDDYVALEQLFQGTTETTGMDFSVNRYSNDNSKVYGYVRYVVPNTDAATKNVTRGMVFTEVNGTQITVDNYISLLFSDAGSYTISLADFNNGDPIKNGKTKDLTKSQFTENPIHKTEIFNEGSKKIGYIMYNSFISDFDDELNTAFGEFKSEGVTDLIVDLRYNGGGSVRTANYLASMITGQFEGEVVNKQLWNSKVNNAVEASNFISNFPSEINGNQAINSLNLDNVYFIVTGNSASASELVINSLIPYINVKQVGTTTHGKYVGSVTLYDSPDFTKNNVNTSHNWAMQPIVLEIVNKSGTNYKNGIPPTVEFHENPGNLGALGDRDEPLLDRTIRLITTGSRGNDIPFRTVTPEITNSKLQSPMSNNMYVDLK